MSTRISCASVIMTCLLLAGGLFATQTSVRSIGNARMLGAPGLTSPAGHSRLGSPRPGGPKLHDNDVGVSKIISPDDTSLAFGDRAFPRAKVQNFGSETQNDIPVICAIYDSAAGTTVYGPDTVYVASLDSGGVCTVEFPSWLPPSQANVYLDTMRTALPGDEDASNDWKAGRFTVSRMGLEYVYVDPALYQMWTWPWYGYIPKMRFQTLYTSDEIGRGGIVHEMALYKDFYGQNYSGTFPNVTVKLCNTTVSSLGSSFSGNYGGATPVAVYHASYLARGMTDPNGSNYAWDTIDFTTDFEYDNAKNLLVEITWQGNDGSGYTYSLADSASSARMAYNCDVDSDTTDDKATTANYEFNTRIGFKSPARNVGRSAIAR